MSQIVGLLIILVGFLVAPFLFYKIPKLEKNKEAISAGTLERLSVIIPARNEKMSLPHLLADLTKDWEGEFEILVVDDGSEDDTYVLAKSFGVKVISVTEKPQGWLGKTYACHKGALEARGSLLLFLDADVRLNLRGLKRLLSTYETYGAPLSVQPFHQPIKPYEELAFFFNILQVGANGIALPNPLNIGLYGPVILMSRTDYISVGGHEGVQGDVVEDMALGKKFHEKKMPFHLFVGDEDVAFRMYPDGFQGLYQGFTKNIASGAMRIPPLVFWMVFLFLSSLISVVLHLFRAGLQGDLLGVIAFFVGYILWVSFLFFVARKIGRFRWWTVLCYPVPLGVLLYVFSISLWKKITGKKVQWKGRSI